MSNGATSSGAPRSSYRDVLRDRVAGRLMLVRSVSLVGDSMAIAALIVLAYGGSESVVAGAAVLAVRAVPTLIVAVFLGGWLDRLPRRSGMIAFALLEALVLLVPAIWPSQQTALVASGLSGATSAAYISLSSAIVAEQVSRPLQLPYYALAGTIHMSAQVVGLLGGASLALAFSPSIALAVDVASFVVGALLLTGLPRLHAVRSGESSSSGASLASGWGVIWGNPTLRLLSILVWASFASGDLPEVVAPAVAADAWVPPVMAASALGGVVLLLAVGRRGLLGSVRNQLRFASAYGASLVVGAVAIELEAGPVALIVVNAAIGACLAWTVGAQAVFARLVPEGRRAQAEIAMVSTNTVVGGLSILGLGALGGWTGHPALAYLVGGLVVLGVALPRVARAASTED